MAVEAGCSRPTILTYIAAGKIVPDFRIGKNRVAFLPESVDRVKKALAQRCLEAWGRFCAKYDAEHPMEAWRRRVRAKINSKRRKVLVPS